MELAWDVTVTGYTSQPPICHTLNDKIKPEYIITFHVKSA
jgi:hypothetical protein